MVRELKLKLQVTIISLIIVSCSLADSICLMWCLVLLTLDQVVMSFHECGGNFGDDVCIPLPHWVAEIGRSSYETRDSVFVSLSVAPKAAFSLQTSQITNHNFTHITCITHPFPNKTPNATTSFISRPNFALSFFLLYRKTNTPHTSISFIYCFSPSICHSNS